MSFYPSHRYHQSGATRLIHNPDQEPEGPEWRDRPWPPVVVQPVLQECCQRLKAQFDSAFDKLLAERDALALELEVLKRALETEDQGEEEQPECSDEQSEGNPEQSGAAPARRRGRPAGSLGKKKAD